MTDTLFAVRGLLQRLAKPFLILVIAVTVVTGAVYLFDLTAQRARAAAGNPVAEGNAATATGQTPSVQPQAPAVPAPATPAPTTTPANGHQVAAGETLAEIAVHYDVPAEQLAADNGMPDPNLIRAGQRLRIGAKAAGVHVIKPGETLIALAAQYNRTLPELRNLNPTITDPDHILAGNQLRLAPA